MALPFLVDVYTKTWEEEKKDRDGGDQVWVCIQMNSQGLKDAENQVYCPCTSKKSTRNLCVHCRGEVALTTMEGKHVHSHFTILTGPVDQ